MILPRGVRVESKKDGGDIAVAPTGARSGFQYQSKLRFTVIAQVRGKPGE